MNITDKLVHIERELDEIERDMQHEFYAYQDGSLSSARAIYSRVGRIVATLSAEYDAVYPPKPTPTFAPHGGSRAKSPMFGFDPLRTGSQLIPQWENCGGADVCPLNLEHKDCAYHGAAFAE